MCDPSSLDQLQVQFNQWNASCPIDQSILNESNILIYLKSLEWMNNTDHIILKECNELLALYGRRLVTTNSAGESGRRLTFNCCHGGVYRAAKLPSHPATDQSNDATTQRNQDSGDAKEQRLTSTGRIGCNLRILFTLTKRNKYDSSGNKAEGYESWRISSIPGIEFGESFHDVGHSTLCHPELRLQFGGVLHMYQLTKPMMDDIMMMYKGTIKLCQIRVAIQKKYELNHVDFALLQNFVNRNQPRVKPPEITRLIEYFDQQGTSIRYRCKWQTAQDNGRAVNEIRNVFWCSEQMIRLFHEYGQLLVVDATYRSNNFDMKLVLFTIRAGTGKFTIVGLALLQHETSEDVQWAFNELLTAGAGSLIQNSSTTSASTSKHASQGISHSTTTASTSTSVSSSHQSTTQPMPANQTRQVDAHLITQCAEQVRNIMTDGAPGYSAIISNLFPHATHQLCSWHHQERVTRFCREHTDGKKASRAAREAIVAVSQAQDRSNAEKLWQQMREYHFDKRVEHIDKPKDHVETAAAEKARNLKNEVSANARALLDSWYRMRAKWWQSYTSRLLNFGSISSQAGESMNHAIKRRNHVEFVELIEMTQRVVDNHVFGQMRAMNQAYRIPLRGRSDQAAWTASLRYSLTIFCTDLLTKQLDAAEEYGFKFSSSYVVNLTESTCTCAFFQQYGLMCRHLMLAWLKQAVSTDQSSTTWNQPPQNDHLFTHELRQPLAQQCIISSPSRWTHAAAKRVFGTESSTDSYVALPVAHHQFTNSRPAVHIPDTKLMLQIEIDNRLSRVQLFAKRDIIALRIVLAEIAALEDRLESLYTQELVMPSIQPTDPAAIDRQAQNLDEMPANGVDPVNSRVKKRGRTLSTAEAAKVQTMQD